VQRRARFMRSTGIVGGRREVLVPAQFGPQLASETLFMKYTEIFTVSALANNTALTTAFNCNSIFAPQSAFGSAIKPYGYDQIDPFFNRYRVLAVKIHVQLTPVSSTPIFFACLPTNNALAVPATTLQTFENLCMMNRCKHTSTSTTTPISLHFSESLHVLTGVTKQRYLSDDIYQANLSASPNEIIRFYVAVFNATGAGLTMDFKYDITFKVNLFDPQNFGGSTFQMYAYIKSSPELLTLVEEMAEQHGYEKPNPWLPTPSARLDTNGFRSNGDKNEVNVVPFGNVNLSVASSHPTSKSVPFDPLGLSEVEVSVVAAMRRSKVRSL